MMLVPPCPAKAFPQRRTPESRACELGAKTLTALESVGHVSYSSATDKVWCLSSAAPTSIIASLVWSQAAGRRTRTQTNSCDFENNPVLRVKL